MARRKAEPDAKKEPMWTRDVVFAALGFVVVPAAMVGPGRTWARREDQEQDTRPGPDWETQTNAAPTSPAFAGLLGGRSMAAENGDDLPGDVAGTRGESRNTQAGDISSGWAGRVIGVSLRHDRMPGSRHRLSTDPQN
jgi:hypothetical protein